MPAKVVFQIRPLSIQKGFELDCEGVLSESLRIDRLFEAVATAAQVGRDLDAEIHIFDTKGEVAEVLPLPAKWRLEHPKATSGCPF